MKTLITILLPALLASTNPKPIKELDEAAKAARAKEVKLEIGGLVGTFSKDWYIPNQQVVFVHLVPGKSDILEVDSVVAANRKLAAAIKDYLIQAEISVTSSEAILLKLVLKP